MPTFNFFLYAPGALSAAGGRISLKPGFDPAADRLSVEITDDDNKLGGDFFANEVGMDPNQTGTVRDLDGNVVAGGPDARIYAEQVFNLTGTLPDGSTQTIELYELEIGGTVVGYLPSEPLEEDVSYDASAENVIDFFNDNGATYSGPGAETGAVICFDSGALASTGAGPRPVGDLAPGVQVRTREHGFRPLLWVWRRHLSGRELARRPHLAPVVIEPGALAPGRPARRTRVSPQHRMLIRSAHAELMFGTDTVLVPARALIDGRRIRQVAGCAGVTYVHLLFERHEVIEVDGAWSESLQPGGWGVRHLDPAARAELAALFPDLVAPGSRPCHPVLSMREARLLRAG